jgi:glycosyltransferase involved in cell wall biosynthesis
VKILHVIRGLGNSSGTTHVVVPLAEAQAALGHSVQILCVEKEGHPQVLPDPARVRTTTFALSLPLDNPGVSFPFAREIRRRVEAADVVHIHAVWNFPTWWTMRASASRGVPYIVAPQGSFDPWALQVNSWGKRVYGALTETPLLRRATRLQALTQKEADQIRGALGEVRTSIIPNGVNVERFVGSTVRRSVAAAERRTILSLSRLHPKKGIDRLLAGFARVAPQYPEVDLVVAGDDSGTGYGARLRAMTQELGLGPRVRFIGEQRDRQKIDCLLQADAFALISHSEGLPVAVLEAMAAARPVIVSAECNLPEIERAKAGWVVDGGPDTIADAMRDLLRDWHHAGQCGERGRVLVRERFSWASIAAQTVGVYEECIAGMKGGGGSPSAPDPIHE